MAESSDDRLAQFVERMTGALAESRSRGMVPPIERRLLRTVATQCDEARVTARFRDRLERRLNAAGLHTEPPLTSASLGRGDWVRFSTQPFPAAELLFPKENDLQGFVEASLGTGPFRELRLYRERRHTLGREYRLPDGKRIDLLCEEKLGGLVAIELKRKHQKGTVEQMVGYINAC